MEIIWTKPSLKRNTFHIDGRISGGDGTVSAFNWIRIETGVERLTVGNGLTEHEAVYQALLGVLKYLAPGSRATIFTHSNELFGHFKGGLPTRDRGLAKLFAQARQLIREKELKIHVRYILREDNQAVPASRLAQLKRERRIRRALRRPWDE